MLTISPTAGPMLGGTLVNLTGTRLGDGAAWRCSFGTSIVGAEYFEDAERVGCLSPSSDVAASVLTNVSIDGGSSFCSGEPQPYQYYAPPNVSAISPASGSTEGGTVVTVLGSGFSALTSDRVVCTFGRLRIGDAYRAGAVVGTVGNMSDGLIECIAPTANAADAVGSASFSFNVPLPVVEVLQPCVVVPRHDGCVPGYTDPERIHRFASGHNLTLLGRAIHEGSVLKLTRNLFSETGAMILALYNPGAPAGVPVRAFTASWSHFVGGGTGADGYSFVYADLLHVHTVFGEMGVGDGLIVRFRTRGFFDDSYNEGHGIIEAIYNGTLLNSTFMGDRLRSDGFNEIRAQPVSVRYDDAGLSVSFDGEVVLVCTVPSWAPEVGWSLGWGGRTGERKDNHWIDDLTVQSGYLLDVGTAEFGISLNDGHDISRLGAPAVFTYTSTPAVFSFSPTTGPEQGNTTVTVVGSHFAGGADYRCRYGQPNEHVTHASYDAPTLVCPSPAVRRAQLVPLEVSLNNRVDSTSNSDVQFRFYNHPHLADARGPYKSVAPASVGANVSLLGANFSGGDDYRVAFARPGGSSTIVPATFVNDSLVLAVAPAGLGSGLATVALTLNGQQYTAPTPFPFFEVNSLSPSTGPTLGGTLVRVNGTAFDSGGAYRCRFADAGETEASRMDDETLTCLSPAVAMEGARALEVTLNARDFTASNVTFGFYSHPDTASVYPQNGPVAGATTVAVRSVASGGMANGSHYQCRFGSAIVEGTYARDAPLISVARGPHLNAELLYANPTPAERYLSRSLNAELSWIDEPHGAVLCVAPPNASASADSSATDGPRTVPFAVTLNGQNFHDVAGGFVYYEPPNVTNFAPVRGPASGGTTLTLLVYPPHVTLHEVVLNSTSCRFGGPGHHMPLVHSRPVKAFMSRVFSIAPGVVQCNAPAARRAGALSTLRVDFGATSELRGFLYGNAVLVRDRDRPCSLGSVFSCGGSADDAYTSAHSARCEWLCPTRDGALRLTTPLPYTSGAYVLDTPNVTLAPRPLEFNLTFELLIGKENRDLMAPHGDGSFTVNLGELPARAFGMSGASFGLALQLQFAGRVPMLEVWLEGARLYNEPLYGGVRTGAWTPCHFEVAQRRLSFSVSRVRLIDRLPLPASWNPPSSWRFGFTASNSRQQDEWWLDSVELTAATLLSTAERTVEITLNGQQYVPLTAGSAERFGYYGAARFPSLNVASPSSGPVAGGTIIRLFTNHVEGNLTLLAEDPRTLTTVVHVDPLTAALTLGTFSTSAYRCFLGGDNLTAQFVNETVRCTTAPFEATAVEALNLTLPLNFSVNAQDAIGPLAHFVVYGVSVVSGASPLSGPTNGGTLVVFEGTNLANGSDYRCRFGSGPLVEESPGADVTYASYDVARSVVRCRSPPAISGSAGPAALYLSLNSQNYVRAGAFDFYYTEPLRPTALSPSSGPADGETVVSVSIGSDLTGAFAPRCRFGAEVVAATATAGQLHCASPHASLAPAAALVRMMWLPLNESGTADLVPSDWMYDDASEQSDGSFLLTSGHEGSLGSVIVPSGVLNATTLSFAVFRISFELQAWNGFPDHYGDGLGVSFGLLPPGRMGEYGGGLGLRVCFLTSRRCPPPEQLRTCPSLAVYYATQLLWDVPLAANFRQEGFGATIIEYTTEGLYVSHAGMVYVPRGELFLPDWAPAPGWSIGFSSRSGKNTDFHYIRAVQIELGALVDAASVPLHVSLNAQQYQLVPDVAPYYEAPDFDPTSTFGPRAFRDVGRLRQRPIYEPGKPFTYYGTPNVTALSPASGPTLGNPPALMLSGTGRHTSGGLHGGSHYRCRFGGVGAFEYVDAVVNRTADEVYCVAPAGQPAAALPVGVSLNGQQYHSADATYARLAWAEAISVAIASPVSGPVRGGTLVRISLPAGAAQSLAGGDDYRCRFADDALSNDTRTVIFAHEAAPYYRVTPGTYDPTNGGSVSCYSPPAASQEGVLNATLQLAPNALHFEVVAPFQIYEDAIVSSLSPSSGPLSGATTLVLNGRGLAAGSHAQCWLGSGRSEATLTDEAVENGILGRSQLRCEAPPGLTAEATELQLALNGQQASFSVPFTFYGTAPLLQAMPNHGDALSLGVGTLVRVRTGAFGFNGTSAGDSFANGTDYRCRFGNASQPATFVSDGELHCHAPSEASVSRVDLRVSLNGQQYGPPLDFEFLEAPQVESIEPSSGVFAGGAIVDVAGTGFANRSLLACHFGGPVVDVSGGHFGNATVPGTFVSAGMVRCVAPGGDTAGLEAEWRADFDDQELPPRAVLMGSSVIRGGSVVLTSGRPQQVGSLAIEPTTRAARYFRARFHVHLGTDLGSSGVSFCYGELPLNVSFGAEGVPEGLCLRVHTEPTFVLELVSKTSSAVEASVSRPLGFGMRSGSFAAVTVERTARHGARATIEMGTNGTIATLMMAEADLAPAYAPTPTWRFGFGADCGRVPEMHMIDSVSITSAAFVEEVPVVVAVANNGQQYSRARALFTYAPPPEVSSVSPTSGPLSGATRVVVRGAYLGYGHAPFCRFPQSATPALPPCSDFATGARPVPSPACTGSDGGLIVNASRLGTDDLVCLSPYSPTTALGALEVSVNGQQFTRTGLLYEMVGVGAISSISPSCGPTDGLTLVNVTGTALEGGSDRTCQLMPLGGALATARTVNASRGSGSFDSVLCSTPRAPIGASSLRVSPNAQQYSPPATYDYYAPPVVSTSSPSSGPTSGGTVVVISGSNLASGARCNVVCRFGELLSPGTAAPSEGTITCQAPRNPAALGTTLPLYVSLNRQQFSAGDAMFNYTSAGPLEHAVPRSGPVRGGTRVRVNASSLRGGDDYTCRFVRLTGGMSHVVNATYRASDDLLTCDSPAVESAASGTYNFSVALNRQDYLAPLPFMVYGSPEHSSASPASGPIAGGALVTIRGAHLGPGDNYTCRFGDYPPRLVVLATYDEVAEAVTCVSPAAPAARGLFVRVAPNAQQYAPIGSPFELYAAPPLFTLGPESGPELGGTNVTVTPVAGVPDDSCPLYAHDGACDEPWVCSAGTDCSDCSEALGTSCGLRAGSDRRCRFAAPDTAPGQATVIVAASVVGSVLVCTSPPANVSSDTGGARQVTVSLNAQQYTAHAQGFDFYLNPIVSTATPIGGPTSGGTRIIVSGANLAGGSDYRCDLGAGRVLLPATFDPINGTVACEPTEALEAGTLMVSVRPNGQNAASSMVASLHVSAPPQLDAISPTSGPVLGNTTVRFTGAAMLDTSSDGELRCRFGLHEVPASFDSTSQITCLAPTAAQSGATTTLDIDFSESAHRDVDTAILAPATRSTSSGVRLLGEATFRPAGFAEPHVYVRLTQSAFVGPGACILPGLPAPFAGSPWFAVSFEMRLWGTARAHGLSFCYGELPDRAWGEDGASLGLCVLMSTLTDEVRVMLGGQIVHTAPGQSMLRHRYWRTIRITHSRALGGLRFEIDGTHLLDDVPIDVSAMAVTPTWRFGFGARTGPNPTQAEERHDIKNFHATNGAAVGPQNVTAQLTLNGQQFVGRAGFTYLAPAVASSVLPTIGPTAGGTALTVAGALLHGGSDYRCRFTREDSSFTREEPAVLVGDVVTCNSSAVPLAVAALEALSISLNGQQYISDDTPATPSLTFSVLAAPTVFQFSPASGPAAGGTLVALSLGGPAEPSATHTCRFRFGAAQAGAIDVNGTAATGAGASIVLCRAPALPQNATYYEGEMARRSFYEESDYFTPPGYPQPSLEYSLNAQQFTADARPFTFHSPMAISSVSPSSGPNDGGARVTIRGFGLWGSQGALTDVRCAFGDATVPASRAGVGGESASNLVCISPATIRLVTPRMYPLRVALNGQQYSAPAADAFQVYDPPIISSLSPASGPATTGGTSITIAGRGLGRGGTHLRCSYSAAMSDGAGGGSAADGDGLRMVLNATRLASGSLLCISPAELTRIGEPLEALDTVASVRLTVTLNGQQMSNASTFRTFRPHNITRLTPTSGSFLGGTSVNLSLSNAALDTNTPNLTSADSMRCRFGGAIVPASRLDGSSEHVRCVAPSSVDAGALPHRLVQFGHLPEGARLLGRARLHQGVLQLTPEVGIGTLMLDVPNIGGTTLTVAFELILGTGRGGNGVGLVYGPMPSDTYLIETGTAMHDAVGEGQYPDDEQRQRGGVGAGLEIWIRTGSVEPNEPRPHHMEHEVDLLQIAHRGAVVAAKRMDRALRANAFLNCTVQVDEEGLVQVSLGAGVVTLSIQLDGWAPRVGWRLGLGGRCSVACGSPENAQWVDNLVIRSDVLLQTARVPLSLALNGQQFVSHATFAYQANLRISSVQPSQGPAAGGTHLTLRGGNFDGGARHEYRCRFGSDALGWRVVLGTFDERGGTLRCATPAAPALQYPAAPLELQVSSNGQEYVTNATIPFEYYAQPEIELLTPTGGPALGGTLLRVFGTHLYAGTSGHRRCRVGVDGSPVPASFDPTSGALLCTTPASPGLTPASRPLLVALNVDHFDVSAASSPTFEYYAPPYLASIEPRSGLSNGTTVTFRGGAIWRTESDGTTGTTRCRFGNAMLNATLHPDDASAVTCVAPAAAVAGAWSRVHLAFDEPWAAQLLSFEAELRGEARVVNGYLRLLDASVSGTGGGVDAETGLPLFTLDVAGAIVLALPQPAFAPRYFRATFKLRMGGGGGADGVSFSYGDLPAGNIGELGAGRGLRVCFRTYETERIEVWYGGLLVHVQAPPGVNGTLRTGAQFVDVLIEYNSTGLTAGLAGFAFAQALPVPGWAPRAGWRFALGARSGARSDHHHVDDLLIEAGSAATTGAVPVALTLNGLQFTPELHEFVYQHESADEAQWHGPPPGTAAAR